MTDVVKGANNAGRGHSSDERTSNGTRAMMIEVATRLFGENGYSGTTVRDIATQVGILPGSLYAHIGGKEEMLLEIVSSGIDRFVAMVDSVPPNLAPRERLRSMIREHLKVVAANPQWAQVVFHQWRYLSEENQTLVRKKRGGYEKCFADVIRKGVHSGDFTENLDQHVTILVLLGSLNWSAEWLSPNDRRLDIICDLFADTVLNGLVAR